MPSVSIVIDVTAEVAGVGGIARTFDYAKLLTGPTVTLSLADTTGITSYLWQLIDIPSGSAAALSSATAAAPTFSPDVVGTYLIQCTVNDGEAYSRNGVAFTTQYRALRKPAAGETREFDNVDGWKDALSAWVDSLDGDTPGALVLGHSYFFSSQGLVGGTRYIAGWYRAPSADANLDQITPSQIYGTANISYAAHAFAVCGGAGAVAAGVGNKVSLIVEGTSIDDTGLRTPLDSAVLIDDITTTAIHEYYETAKKWIGQITFKLTITGGAPATYSLDFNYGLAKYEDFANIDFSVENFEVVGLGDANDAGFAIELLHHTSLGWTYNAAAFIPGSSPAITSLFGIHDAEDQIAASEPFAFKVNGLGVAVAGSGSEGILIRVVTGVPNTIEYMTCHIEVVRT